VKHAVLLGDSIFDNGSYVGIDELDVPNQLINLSKNVFKVTNLAVDGHLISHITNQLSSLPSDASHLFLSIGGNDGLRNLFIFQKSVSTIGEALKKMYLIGEDFKHAYSQALDSVLYHNLPTTVCNIYYPKFFSQSLERVESYLPPAVDAKMLQQMAMAAETIFNDIIMYEAFKRNLPLIDLRILFNEDKDFANPIEPSTLGGMKIAKKIKKIILHHDFMKKDNSSTVY
jgi:hypothetical protein